MVIEMLGPCEPTETLAFNSLLHVALGYLEDAEAIIGLLNHGDRVVYKETYIHKL